MSRSAGEENKGSKGDEKPFKGDIPPLQDEVDQRGADAVVGDSRKNIRKDMKKEKVLSPQDAHPVGHKIFGVEKGKHRCSSLLGSAQKGAAIYSGYRCLERWEKVHSGRSFHQHI